MTSALAAIEGAVRRQPGGDAIDQGGRVISYAELWSTAERAARYLRRHGVGPGSVVAVKGKRSADMVATFLGAWLCGASFLPVDLGTPRRRIEVMLRAGSATVFVGDGQDLPFDSTPSFPMSGVLNGDGPEGRQPPPQLCPQDVAYILFTSGSTGLPKGVTVPHGALANLVSSFAHRLDVTPTDKILWKTTPAFDMSGLELWLPLACGVTMAITSEEPGVDPGAFVRDVTGMGVTVLQGTPSMWRLLMEAGWTPEGVRVGLCGGESMPEDLAGWLTRILPRALNCYGPTETTIWSSCFDLAEWRGGPVPIGLPIDATDLYLLDESMHEVDEDEIGQIFIGGIGLAHGYGGQAGLSADRFLPNPFGTGGERLYATGDLGVIHDGELLFSGRVDRQVKVRGHRVELDEVCDTLLRHPQVRDAAVTVVTADGASDLLSAFVVPGSELIAGAAEMATAERADAWSHTFESGYAEEEGAPPDDFMLNGWDSSISGERFPAEEVFAWRDSVTASVCGLAPHGILEIGAGGGLMTHALAPTVDRYLATDPAGEGLRRLAATLQKAGLTDVRLDQLAGHECGRHADEGYDCVLMTTVVQYFPSESYLRRVIDQALSVVGEDGLIFIADLRHPGLLRAYHTWRELQATDSPTPEADLIRRVNRRMADEVELIVPPQWFVELATVDPRVRAVAVGPATARTPYELSAFRYQAVLVTGRVPGDVDRVPSYDWATEVGSVGRLKELLVQSDAPIVVERIPNSRVAALLGRVEEILAMEQPVALTEDPSPRIDPADLIEVASVAGWEAQLRERPDELERFDIILGPRTEDRGSMARRLVTIADRISTGAPQSSSTRVIGDPAVRHGLVELRRRLGPELQAHLRADLPEYMVPERITLVDALPVTTSGKVDYRALSQIDDAAQARLPYDRPTTATETSLAEVWGEVLDIRGEIGRDDRFVELGGHSLAAARVASRIRDLFAVEVTPRMVFRHQKLSELAGVVDELRPLTQATSVGPVEGRG